MRMGTDWEGVRKVMAARGFGSKPAMAADLVLNLFGVDVPPVPVERLARELGTNLARFKTGTAAGALDFDDTGCPSILVKSTDAHVRQRFTIAHELGHLLLHEKGRHFRDNAKFSGSYLETEANKFASALLMPLHLLEPLAMRTRDARTLAEIFDVSEAAMGYQLQVLLGAR